MTHKQQQERKKLKRLQKAKRRVLARRRRLREADREARQIAKMKKHFAVKSVPIRNEPQGEAAEPAMSPQMPVDDARKVEWIKARLEHNMKILEALEEEFKREDEEREKAQESLEAEGANSMREKMDLIAKKAEEILEKEEKPRPKKIGIRGKSKVRMIPNTPTKTDNKTQ